MAKVTASVGKVASYYKPSTWREKGLKWTIGLFTVTLLIIMLIVGVIWSDEPEPFDVREVALEYANIPTEMTDEEKANVKLQDGYVTTSTAIKLIDTLLNKTGGFIENDVFVPGIYLDNIKNWEFGVLTQIRDITQTLRNDFSRSQTQSAEDKDLAIADPQMHYDSESWALPSSESEYNKGLKALQRFQERLADPNDHSAQFYARADNLTDYLAYIDKRLGSLAQRLASSVGEAPTQAQIDSGEAKNLSPVTPWLQVDNNFYEARGYSWALIHVLKAIEIDFEDVLINKNAMVSLQQIIRELENTQENIWSPIILNGSGFGFVANHSLIMASYISRANAGLIDLRKLLENG